VSGTLNGNVVDIDDAGNLVTDILGTSLVDVPRDASVRIVVDEHETFGLYPVDHSQPSLTLVAILQDSKPLKIILVGDSASDMLGVKRGAPVEVHW
jgi:S-adenosylmethionine hydrolase